MIMKAIIGIFCFLFLTIIAAAQDLSDTSEAKAKLFSDAIVALPLESKISLRWAVFPLEDKIAKKANWNNILFAVDAKGRIWLGHDQKNIINLTKGFQFTLNQSISDFVFLEDGLLLAADKSIGFIPAFKRDFIKNKGIPVLAFQPLLDTPVINPKVSLAGKETIYITGYNPKSKNYEVYILQREENKFKDKGKKSLRALKKLFSTKEKISAVTGEGEELYIAQGRLILKVISGKKEVKGIFLHPDEPINNILYSAQKGLFYTTNSGVGFLGSNLKAEFLNSPNTQICLRNGALYVFLGGSFGVLCFDGIEELNKIPRF